MLCDCLIVLIKLLRCFRYMIIENRDFWLRNLGFMFWFCFVSYGMKSRCIDRDLWIVCEVNWYNVIFVMNFRFWVVIWAQWMIERLSIWTMDGSLCREGLRSSRGFLKVFRSRSLAQKTTWCCTRMFVTLSILIYTVCVCGC